MCDEVVIVEPSSGKHLRELGNIQELRQEGWIVLLGQDCEVDWPDDVCLCGVDIEAILRRAKVEFTNEGCWGEYIVKSST